MDLKPKSLKLLRVQSSEERFCWRWGRFCWSLSTKLSAPVSVDFEKPDPFVSVLITCAFSSFSCFLSINYKYTIKPATRELCRTVKNARPDHPTAFFFIPPKERKPLSQNEAGISIFFRSEWGAYAHRHLLPNMDRCEKVGWPF